MFGSSRGLDHNTLKNGRSLGGARFFCDPAQAISMIRILSVLLLMLMLATTAQAARLDEALELAKSGAASLALEVLDLEQPDREKEPEAWMQWERSRIAILAEGNQWERLSRRIAAYPDTLPTDFLAWATSWQVKGLLEQNEGKRARAELMRLIWSFGTEVKPERMAEWRRQVIQSYLAEGEGDDAYAAMVRYRHDYGRADEASLLLSARVLLGQGHPAEAADYVAQSRTSEGRALYLLASLRSGGLPARKVLRSARKMQKAKRLPHRVRQILAGLVAEAALKMEDYASLVMALEHYFTQHSIPPEVATLFEWETNSLWKAYVNYAKGVGNRERLLLGDDAAWLKVAETGSRMYPVRTRCIYALLALESFDAEQRLKAHQRFADLILNLEDGRYLLNQLYLQSNRFSDLQAIPITVRQTLLEPAIASGNMNLASRLVLGLDEPPEGVDRLIWQLRQARILIMGGDYEQGAVILEKQINGTGLASDSIDRLVQVVFDLQTVGEHERAYGLLGALFEKADDPQLRRELLYWMADSRRAQKRHQEAARYYLRSAILFDLDAMDPWAQTARYQAAQSLAEAGLVEDARALYKQLLDVTKEPGRRAVLRRDLQQLLLMQSKSLKGDNG